MSKKKKRNKTGAKTRTKNVKSKGSAAASVGLKGKTKGKPRKRVSYKENLTNRDELIRYRGRILNADFSRFIRNTRAMLIHEHGCTFSYEKIADMTYECIGYHYFNRRVDLRAGRCTKEMYDLILNSLMFYDVEGIRYFSIMDHLEGFREGYWGGAKPPIIINNIMGDGFEKYDWDRGVLAILQNVGGMWTIIERLVDDNAGLSPIPSVEIGVENITRFIVIDFSKTMFMGVSEAMINQYLRDGYEEFQEEYWHGKEV